MIEFNGICFFGTPAHEILLRSITQFEVSNFMTRSHSLHWQQELFVLVFRPWIGMRTTGIAFEEKLVPFDMGERQSGLQVFSPTGKVPVLVDGDDHLGISGDPRSRRPQTSSIGTLA
jgi:hypothetical protein